MPVWIARLILALAAAAALTVPARAAAADVKPTVDCITPAATANTSWVYFGYTNPGSQTFIDFGDDNVVVPGLGFQGQPTVFNTGVYPRVFRAVFNTEAFTDILWALNGQTASASLATPRCVAGTTGAAGAITTTGATLTANVEPDFTQVAYYFEYGEVGGPSSFTTEQRVTPPTDLTVAEPLTGLRPGTTYRYKLVASGSITTVGEERTFTTSALPTPAPKSADVSVRQTITSTLAKPGDLATVTATLANAGPDAAEGVSMTLTLPAAATIEAASLPAGCAAATDGITVTCTIGTLSSGASTTRSIDLRILAFGTARIVGTIASTTADASQANNLTSSDVTVDVPTGTPLLGQTPAATAPPPASLADLVLTRTGPPRPVRVRRTASLSYAVKNAGTAAAPGAVLVIRLPTGVTRGRLSGAACTGRQTLRCALGTLAPGATKTVTVSVRVRRRGTHSDVASVASTTGESSVSNNVVDGTVRGRR